jgi:hypothetical protein
MGLPFKPYYFDRVIGKCAAELNGEQMQVRHIAIVPEEAAVRPSELAAVSSALQTQIVRDVAPVWGVTASVDAFPSLEDVPAGYWPVLLSLRKLGPDAGVYLDANGQPYALVEISPSWGISASHACLELLHDPFGNQTALGPSPLGEGAVTYLMGICDPCTDARHAYAINEVLVSDFSTPAFWGIGEAARYSFKGQLTAPFEVLPGGHLYFHDPLTNVWRVRRHAAEEPVDETLGILEEAGSLREALEARDGLHWATTRLSLEENEARIGLARQRAAQAAQYRAYRLRGSLALRRQLGSGQKREELGFEREVRAALNAAPSRRRPNQSQAEEPVLDVGDDELQDENQTAIIDRVLGDVTVKPLVAASPVSPEPQRAARATSVPPPLPGSVQPSSPATETRPIPSSLAPVIGATTSPTDKPRSTEQPRRRETLLYGVAVSVAALTVVLFAFRGRPLQARGATAAALGAPAAAAAPAPSVVPTGPVVASTIAQPSASVAPALASASASPAPAPVAVHARPQLAAMPAQMPAPVPATKAPIAPAPTRPESATLARSEEALEQLVDDRR